MECRPQNSVWLSICPSVKRMHCDKTKDRSVQIFIPYERSLSLVFWEEEWLVGATPSTWNFGSTGHRWSEIANFQSKFARNATAVAPRKKVQLTLIGSQLRAFQWTSYVAPNRPPRAFENAKRFPSKIALCLKKDCYKVSLCENCQRQSCREFIDLSIRAKMIGGHVPFYVKIGDYWPTPCTTPIFNLHSLVAPRP